jgi:hypothetical protein
MHDHEAQRLAAMGNALRPDWPAKSLQTFIERNLGARAYADTAIALAWVCTRTKTDTPRLLLESGPWWRATVVPGEMGWRPPRKDESCEKHPGSWRDHCSGCAADQRAGDATQAGDPKRPEAAQARSLARAELAVARANACRHGINRSRAVCADCAKAETEPTPEPAEEIA